MKQGKRHPLRRKPTADKSGHLVAWSEQAFDRRNDLLSGRRLGDYGSARAFVVELYAPRMDHVGHLLLV